MKSFDVTGLVMVAIQVAGMAATMVLLMRFTPLPPWACFVVGIPLFLAVFLGLVWVLSGRRRGR